MEGLQNGQNMMSVRKNVEVEYKKENVVVQTLHLHMVENLVPAL